MTTGIRLMTSNSRSGPVPIRSRPYDGDDDAHALVDIVDAATATDPRCSYWHVGDVWWGLHQNTVFDPHDNIRLWIDDGTPMGFAWTYSRGVVSMQVRPGYADPDALEDEMLSWAEKRRRTLPADGEGASVLTTAFEHDTRRIALLARRGYERTGTPMYHFHQS